MKKNSYENLYYALMIVAIVVSFIPMIVISFYNYPSADDFNYSILTFQAWRNTHSISEVLKAAMQTTINFWNNWQGLYVSAFLLALQPGIFGSQWYTLSGIIMLFVIVGSTLAFSVYFLRRILKRSFLKSVTFGFVMSFLMIQCMPSVVEGIYWFNGAMNYGFFFGVLLIFICLMVELQITRDKKKELLMFSLCAFMIFLLEGGNHVTALMGIVFTVVLAIVCLKRSKTKSVKNIIILIIGTGLLFLNLKSPGTAVRAEALGGIAGSKMGLLFTILRATWESIRNIGEWFGFSEVLLIILMLPAFLDITGYLRKEFQFTFKYPMVVIVLSVAWMSIMYCPPFYALGGCGANRLINIVYFSYIILLFINAGYIIGWLQNFILENKVAKVNVENARFLQTASILVLALFLSTVMKTWAFEAVTELYNGEAKVYSEQCIARETIILESRGEQVEVSNFTVEPSMLFFDDIAENANNWKNIGMSKYYGLESIIRKK